MTNILVPSKAGELARVFNPLADLYFVLSKGVGQSYYLTLEPRIHCGAPFLHRTQIHDKITDTADVMRLVAAFDYDKIDCQPYQRRAELYYDRQSYMLYAFENQHTAIWSNSLCTLPEIESIVDAVANDYGIAAPTVRVSPEFTRYEYDPEFNEVLIAAEDDEIYLCSPEIVLHEMAHAILCDLDEYRAHHHPCFAKMVIDLYADYLGYDRCILYAKADEMDLFGPMNPFDVTQWQDLPKPEQVSPLTFGARRRARAKGTDLRVING